MTKYVVYEKDYVHSLSPHTSLLLQYCRNFSITIFPNKCYLSSVVPIFVSVLVVMNYCEHAKIARSLVLKQENAVLCMFLCYFCAY